MSVELDPLFNSREPVRDWEMVVRHGGHAMGLSPLMPPQGGSLSDDDIRNMVAYVKTLADTSDYPPGEFNLMLPVRTKKAFPEDELAGPERTLAAALKPGDYPVLRVHVARCEELPVFRETREVWSAPSH